MYKAYAGIGSRDTPKEVLELMFHLGEWLANKGYTLRSGHAQGADISFESGCIKACGAKEIYIPWQGFNHSTSNFFRISNAAYDIAKKYHPAWDRCSKYAKDLMARNSYQVLGIDLNSPCKFIICYTDKGKLIGGTAQALRIAMAYNIPIFNFGSYNSVEEMKKAFNQFYFNLIHSRKR